MGKLGDYKFFKAENIGGLWRVYIKGGFIANMNDNTYDIFMEEDNKKELAKYQLQADKCLDEVYDTKLGKFRAVPFKSNHSYRAIIKAEYDGDITENILLDSDTFDKYLEVDWNDCNYIQGVTGEQSIGYRYSDIDNSLGKLMEKINKNGNIAYFVDLINSEEGRYTAGELLAILKLKLYTTFGDISLQGFQKWLDKYDMEYAEYSNSKCELQVDFDVVDAFTYKTIDNREFPNWEDFQKRKEQRANRKSYYGVDTVPYLEYINNVSENKFFEYIRDNAKNKTLFTLRSELLTEGYDIGRVNESTLEKYCKKYALEYVELTSVDTITLNATDLKLVTYEDYTNWKEDTSVFMKALKYLEALRMNKEKTEIIKLSNDKLINKCREVCDNKTLPEDLIWVLLVLANIPFETSTISYTSYRDVTLKKYKPTFNGTSVEGLVGTNKSKYIELMRNANKWKINYKVMLHFMWELLSDNIKERTFYGSANQNSNIKLESTRNVGEMIKAEYGDVKTLVESINPTIEYNREYKPLLPIRAIAEIAVLCDSGKISNQSIISYIMVKYFSNEDRGIGVIKIKAEILMMITLFRAESKIDVNEFGRSYISVMKVLTTTFNREGCEYETAIQNKLNYFEENNVLSYEYIYGIDVNEINTEEIYIWQDDTDNVVKVIDEGYNYGTSDNFLTTIKNDFSKEIQELYANDNCRFDLGLNIEQVQENLDEIMFMYKNKDKILANIEEQLDIIIKRKVEILSLLEEDSISDVEKYAEYGIKINEAEKMRKQKLEEKQKVIDIVEKIDELVRQLYDDEQRQGRKIEINIPKYVGGEQLQICKIDNRSIIEEETELDKQDEEEEKEKEEIRAIDIDKLKVERTHTEPSRDIAWQHRLDKQVQYYRDMKGQTGKKFYIATINVKRGNVNEKGELSLVVYAEDRYKAKTEFLHELNFRKQMKWITSSSEGRTTKIGEYNRYNIIKE